MAGAQDDAWTPPQTPLRRPRHLASRAAGAGSVGVGVVLVLAGLLFTTSAATSRGTQLRSERADLADLIAAEDLGVKVRAQRLASLDAEVTRLTAVNAADSRTVRAIQDRTRGIGVAAGLSPVTGPGLRVTLDDAPRDVPVAAGAGPNDLVVHQQDVQAVVNALWAGGAEAMGLQDQRVISTSAVRCVGNTLILQGRVYSPPYTITAIGDVRTMRAALDRSPEVNYYLQYVASLRLGWSVERGQRLKLPAYAGTLALEHARVAGQQDPAGSGSATTGTTGTTTPREDP